MKNLINVLIIFTLIVSSNLLVGQDNVKESPLSLEISFDETGTDLNINLVNKAGKDVNVIKKDKLGQFRNLVFIVVSDDNDSTYIEFDPSFRDLTKIENDVNLDTLVVDQKKNSSIDQFISRYPNVFIAGHEYTIQAVFQTLYETPLDGQETWRSKMIDHDVYSNKVVIKL